MAAFLEPYLSFFSSSISCAEYEPRRRRAFTLGATAGVQWRYPLVKLCLGRRRAKDRANPTNAVIFYLSFVILTSVTQHVFKEPHALTGTAPEPIADAALPSTSAPTNEKHAAMWGAAQSGLAARA